MAFSEFVADVMLHHKWLPAPALFSYETLLAQVHINTLSKEAYTLPKEPNVLPKVPRVLQEKFQCCICMRPLHAEMRICRVKRGLHITKRALHATLSNEPWVLLEKSPDEMVACTCAEMSCQNRPAHC